MEIEYLESDYLESDYTVIDHNDIDDTEHEHDHGTKERILPIRNKLLSPATEHLLQIHPLPSADGLLVKIRPPREPLDTDLTHVPSDIVLVIDVSGSMFGEASVPSESGETTERNGLSILDLTKHAARTIMETLNDRDRLGIVTFSNDAKV